MAQPPMILVVEDDLEMNQLERELLSLSGLASIPAYNGLEALQRLEANGIDAVLLDLMLPEMDGFEACRRVRQCCGRHLPIVIVTALDNEASRRQGAQAGSDAYFTKPFDPEELVRTLRTLLENSHPEGDSRASTGSV